MGITRLRLRFPSPALTLSCLALFAALGGTYAATQATASDANPSPLPSTFALAYVKPNGKLNKALSRNVISVAHISPGLYCFDLSRVPLNAVASPDLFTNSNATAQTTVKGRGVLSACHQRPHLKTIDAAVEIRDSAGLPVDGRDFYVAFSR
jgi:hypothetical protein